MRANYKPKTVKPRMWDVPHELRKKIEDAYCREFKPELDANCRAALVRRDDAREEMQRVHIQIEELQSREKQLREDEKTALRDWSRHEQMKRMETERIYEHMFDDMMKERKKQRKIK